MKLLYIVGNRPQFIKLAVLHQQMKKYSSVEEHVIHTGQHFSSDMNDIFFDELFIDLPVINLQINTLSHVAMIGRFLEALEQVLQYQMPDLIVVFGDTNTTLAGALTAKKLNIPIAHVEAGIRTSDEDMPEESNRYLTDRLSLFNFCCTSTGLENLKKEGYGSAIQSYPLLTGDIMLDAYNHYYSRFAHMNAVSESMNISGENYVTCTIHRRQNIEDEISLSNIVTSLNEIHKEHTIICPVHPYTKKKLEKCSIQARFLTIPPLGYLKMQNLLHQSKYVITDSGGVQREAFFARKPVLIIMDKPFWPEVIENGNALNCIAQREDILSTFEKLKTLQKKNDISVFGNGTAAETIAKTLFDFFGENKTN